jgi:hypothetical protein
MVTIVRTRRVKVPNTEVQESWVQKSAATGI